MPTIGPITYCILRIIGTTGVWSSSSPCRATRCCAPGCRSLGMSDAVATRDDHQRFCAVEGWVQVRNARGKPVRHHETYELSLFDGRILRTRISRPVNRTTYGPAMFG